MHHVILALSVAFVLSATQSVLAQDSLPSWHDTAPKPAIIAFVEKVTKEGSPDFVAPSDRVAVFDNDGTLIYGAKIRTHSKSRLSWTYSSDVHHLNRH